VLSTETSSLAKSSAKNRNTRYPFSWELVLAPVATVTGSPIVTPAIVASVQNAKSSYALELPALAAVVLE